MIQRGLKSSLIGIAFNFVLASFKCTTGFIGHSFALVADGIESLSDVLSSTVVYLGLRVSIRPPDEDHPYGHGKAYSKINAAGEWIDRTETASLNDLFDRMSTQELEAYAQTGAQPG